MVSVDKTQPPSSPSQGGGTAASAGDGDLPSSTGEAATSSEVGSSNPLVRTSEVPLATSSSSSTSVSGACERRSGMEGKGRSSQVASKDSSSVRGEMQLLPTLRSVICDLVSFLQASAEQPPTPPASRCERSMSRRQQRSKAIQLISPADSLRKRLMSIIHSSERCEMFSAEQILLLSRVGEILLGVLPSVDANDTLELRAALCGAILGDIQRCVASNAFPEFLTRAQTAASASTAECSDRHAVYLVLVDRVSRFMGDNSISRADVCGELQGYLNVIEEMFEHVGFIDCGSDEEPESRSAGSLVSDMEGLHVSQSHATNSVDEFVQSLMSKEAAMVPKAPVSSSPANPILPFVVEFADTIPSLLAMTSALVLTASRSRNVSVSSTLPAWMNMWNALCAGDPALLVSMHKHAGKPVSIGTQLVHFVMSAFEVCFSHHVDEYTDGVDMLQVFSELLDAADSVMRLMECPPSICRGFVARCLHTLATRCTTHDEWLGLDVCALFVSRFSERCIADDVGTGVAVPETEPQVSQDVVSREPISEALVMYFGKPRSNTALQAAVFQWCQCILEQAQREEAQEIPEGVGADVTAEPAGEVDDDGYGLCELFHCPGDEDVSVGTNSTKSGLMDRPSEVGAYSILLMWTVVNPCPEAVDLPAAWGLLMWCSVSLKEGDVEDSIRGLLARYLLLAVDCQPSYFDSLVCAMEQACVTDFARGIRNDCAVQVLLAGMYRACALEHSDAWCVRRKRLTDVLGVALPMGLQKSVRSAILGDHDLRFLSLYWLFVQKMDTKSQWKTVKRLFAAMGYPEKSGCGDADNVADILLCSWMVQLSLLPLRFDAESPFGEAVRDLFHRADDLKSAVATPTILHTLLGNGQHGVAPLLGYIGSGMVVERAASCIFLSASSSTGDSCLPFSTTPTMPLVCESDADIFASVIQPLGELLIDVAALNYSSVPGPTNVMNPLYGVLFECLVTLINALGYALPKEHYDGNTIVGAALVVVEFRRAAETGGLNAAAEPLFKLLREQFKGVSSAAARRNRMRDRYMLRMSAPVLLAALSTIFEMVPSKEEHLLTNVFHECVQCFHIMTSDLLHEAGDRLAVHASRNDTTYGALVADYMQSGSNVDLKEVVPSGVYPALNEAVRYWHGACNAVYPILEARGGVVRLRKFCTSLNTADTLWDMASHARWNTGSQFALLADTQALLSMPLVPSSADVRDPYILWTKVMVDRILGRISRLYVDGMTRSYGVGQEYQSKARSSVVGVPEFEVAEGEDGEDEQFMEGPREPTPPEVAAGKPNSLWSVELCSLSLLVARMAGPRISATTVLRPFSLLQMYAHSEKMFKAYCGYKRLQALLRTLLRCKPGSDSVEAQGTYEHLTGMAEDAVQKLAAVIAPRVQRRVLLYDIFSAAFVLEGNCECGMVGLWLRCLASCSVSKELKGTLSVLLEAVLRLFEHIASRYSNMLPTTVTTISWSFVDFLNAETPQDSSMKELLRVEDIYASMVASFESVYMPEVQTAATSERKTPHITWWLSRFVSCIRGFRSVYCEDPSFACADRTLNDVARSVLLNPSERLVTTSGGFDHLKCVIALEALRFSYVCRRDFWSGFGVARDVGMKCQQMVQESLGGDLDSHLKCRLVAAYVVRYLISWLVGRQNIPRTIKRKVRHVLDDDGGSVELVNEVSESFAKSNNPTLVKEVKGQIETESKRSSSEKAKVSCSYRETGTSFIDQDWYYCFSCKLVEGEGCCAACVRVCHAGHEVAFARSSRFFCDCGHKSGTRRNACICLDPLGNKEVKPVAATVAEKLNRYFVAKDISWRTALPSTMSSLAKMITHVQDSADIVLPFEPLCGMLDTNQELWEKSLSELAATMRGIADFASSSEWERAVQSIVGAGGESENDELLLGPALPIFIPMQFSLGLGADLKLVDGRDVATLSSIMQRRVDFDTDRSFHKLANSNSSLRRPITASELRYLRSFVQTPTFEQLDNDGAYAVTKYCGLRFRFPIAINGTLDYAKCVTPDVRLFLPSADLRGCGVDTIIPMLQQGSQDILCREKAECSFEVSPEKLRGSPDALIGCRLTFVSGPDIAIPHYCEYGISGGKARRMAISFGKMSYRHVDLVLSIADSLKLHADENIRMFVRYGRSYGNEFYNSIRIVVNEVQFYARSVADMEREMSLYRELKDESRFCSTYAEPANTEFESSPLNQLAGLYTKGFKVLTQASLSLLVVSRCTTGDSRDTLYRPRNVRDSVYWGILSRLLPLSSTVEVGPDQITANSDRSAAPVWNLLVAASNAILKQQYAPVDAPDLDQLLTEQTRLFDNTHCSLCVGGDCTVSLTKCNISMLGILSRVLVSSESVLSRFWEWLDQGESKMAPVLYRSVEECIIFVLFHAVATDDQRLSILNSCIRTAIGKELPLVFRLAMSMISVAFLKASTAASKGLLIDSLKDIVPHMSPQQLVSFIDILGSTTGAVLHGGKAAVSVMLYRSCDIWQTPFLCTDVFRYADEDIRIEMLKSILLNHVLDDVAESTVTPDSREIALVRPKGNCIWSAYVPAAKSSTAWHFQRKRSEYWSGVLKATTLDSIRACLTAPRSDGNIQRCLMEPTYQGFALRPYAEKVDRYCFAVIGGHLPECPPLAMREKVSGKNNSASFESISSPGLDVFSRLSTNFPGEFSKYQLFLAVVASMQRLSDSIPKDTVYGRWVSYAELTRFSSYLDVAQYMLKQISDEAQFTQLYTEFDNYEYVSATVASALSGVLQMVITLDMFSYPLLIERAWAFLAYAVSRHHLLCPRQEEKTELISMFISRAENLHQACLLHPFSRHTRMYCAETVSAVVFQLCGRDRTDEVFETLVGRFLESSLGACGSCLDGVLSVVNRYCKHARQENGESAPVPQCLATIATLARTYIESHPAVSEDGDVFGERASVVLPDELSTSTPGVLAGTTDELLFSRDALSGKIAAGLFDMYRIELQANGWVSTSTADRLTDAPDESYLCHSMSASALQSFCKYERCGQMIALRQSLNVVMVEVAFDLSRRGNVATELRKIRVSGAQADHCEKGIPKQEYWTELVTVNAPPELGKGVDSFHLPLVEPLNVSHIRVELIGDNLGALGMSCNSCGHMNYSERALFCTRCGSSPYLTLELAVTYTRDLKTGPSIGLPWAIPKCVSCCEDWVGPGVKYLEKALRGAVQGLDLGSVPQLSASRFLTKSLSSWDGSIEDLLRSAQLINAQRELLPETMQDGDTVSKAAVNAMLRSHVDVVSAEVYLLRARYWLSFMKGEHSQHAVALAVPRRVDSMANVRTGLQNALELWTTIVSTWPRACGRGAADTYIRFLSLRPEYIGRPNADVFFVFGTDHGDEVGPTLSSAMKTACTTVFASSSAELSIWATAMLRVLQSPADTMLDTKLLFVQLGVFVDTLRCLKRVPPKAIGILQMVITVILHRVFNAPSLLSDRFAADQCVHISLKYLQSTLVPQASTVLDGANNVLAAAMREGVGENEYSNSLASSEDEDTDYTEEEDDSEIIYGDDIIETDDDDDDDDSDEDEDSEDESGTDGGSEDIADSEEDCISERNSAKEAVADSDDGSIMNGDVDEEDACGTTGEGHLVSRGVFDELDQEEIEKLMAECDALCQEDDRSVHFINLIKWSFERGEWGYSNWRDLFPCIKNAPNILLRVLEVLRHPWHANVWKVTGDGTTYFDVLADVWVALLSCPDIDSDQLPSLSPCSEWGAFAAQVRVNDSRELHSSVVLAAVMGMVDVSDLFLERSSCAADLNGVFDEMIKAYLYLLRATFVCTGIFEFVVSHMEEWFTEVVSKSNDTWTQITAAWFRVLSQFLEDGDTADGREMVSLLCSKMTILNTSDEATVKVEPKLVFRKKPSQEEFIPGDLGTDAIDPRALKLETFRDVKRYICEGLELHSLIDDDFGMEMLIMGRIVSLTLPVEDVYTHFFLGAQEEGNRRQSSSRSRSMGRGSGATDTQRRSLRNLGKSRNMSSTPPMEITYRLQGLEGDATEPMLNQIAPTAEENGTGDVDFRKLMNDSSWDAMTGLMRWFEKQMRVPEARQPQGVAGERWIAAVSAVLSALRATALNSDSQEAYGAVAAGRPLSQLSIVLHMLQESLAHGGDTDASGSLERVPPHVWSLADKMVEFSKSYLYELRDRRRANGELSQELDTNLVSDTTECINMYFEFAQTIAEDIVSCGDEDLVAGLSSISEVAASNTHRGELLGRTSLYRSVRLIMRLAGVLHALLSDQSQLLNAFLERAVHHLNFEISDHVDRLVVGAILDAMDTPPASTAQDPGLASPSRSARTLSQPILLSPLPDSATSADGSDVDAADSPAAHRAELRPCDAECPLLAVLVRKCQAYLHARIPVDTAGGAVVFSPSRSWCNEVFADIDAPRLSQVLRLMGILCSWSVESQRLLLENDHRTLSVLHQISSARVTDEVLRRISIAAETILNEISADPTSPCRSQITEIRAAAKREKKLKSDKKRRRVLKKLGMRQAGPPTLEDSADESCSSFSQVSSNERDASELSSDQQTDSADNLSRSRRVVRDRSGISSLAETDGTSPITGDSPSPSMSTISISRTPQSAQSELSARRALFSDSTASVSAVTPRTESGEISTTANHRILTEFLCSVCHEGFIEEPETFLNVFCLVSSGRRRPDIPGDEDGGNQTCAELPLRSLPLFASAMNCVHLGCDSSYNARNETHNWAAAARLNNHAACNVCFPLGGPHCSIEAYADALKRTISHLCSRSRTYEAFDPALYESSRWGREFCWVGCLTASVLVSLSSSSNPTKHHQTRMLPMLLQAGWMYLNHSGLLCEGDAGVDDDDDDSVVVDVGVSGSGDGISRPARGLSDSVIHLSGESFPVLESRSRRMAYDRYADLISRRCGALLGFAPDDSSAEVCLSDSDGSDDEYAAGPIDFHSHSRRWIDSDFRVARFVSGTVLTLFSWTAMDWRDRRLVVAETLLEIAAVCPAAVRGGLIRFFLLTDYWHRVLADVRSAAAHSLRQQSVASLPTAAPQSTPVSLRVAVGTAEYSQTAEALLQRVPFCLRMADAAETVVAAAVGQTEWSNVAMEDVSALLEAVEAAYTQEVESGSE